MTTLTFECPVHFGRTGQRKELRAGPAPEALPPGRVPRAARLMALALRFDRLLQDGTVPNAAVLARLGHVTRARVSQILNLLNLAPDIQEALLFLPATVAGRDPIILRDLQPIALTPDWRKQRKMWRSLRPPVPAG